VKDAVPGLLEVGVQRAHPAQEHRHLRGAQGEQLRAVHEQLLGRDGVVPVRDVVAEAVRDRLQVPEGVGVGLLLARVGATRG